MMRLGIDASNISSGGGVTHLIEILSALDFSKVKIENIDVWSNKDTLSKIEARDGIELKHHKDLEKGLLTRFYWQQKKLTDIARNNYDLLFIPGGSYIGSFRPYVTMNRNLQPFDIETRRRYRFSFQKIRLSLLEKIQAYTYKNAEGVIFLSDAARQLTLRKINFDIKNSITVPHGIAPKFFKEPKEQISIDDYSFDDPFTILYASRVNVYKHQWNVIEAVHRLRIENYPLKLILVGNIENNQSRKLFDKALNAFDPERNYVEYHGRISQSELLQFYHNSDGYIFASSCEAFGQILLEAMASALPIACANRSAMPEILEKNGIYFDPEDVADIASSLRKLLVCSELRKKFSSSAFQRAQDFSWNKCADHTFDFLDNIYKNTKN